jgi:hypothetical protein
MHTEYVDRPSTAPQAQEIRELRGDLTASAEAVAELFKRTDRLATALRAVVEQMDTHEDWAEGAIKDLYDRLVFKPSRWRRLIDLLRPWDPYPLPPRD